MTDVDGDGDVDLMLNFRIQDTRLNTASTKGCLSASTVFGESIAECDRVTVSK